MYCSVVDGAAVVGEELVVAAAAEEAQKAVSSFRQRRMRE